MYCTNDVFNFVTLSGRTFAFAYIQYTHARYIHWQLNWHMRNSFSRQHIQSIRYNLFYCIIIYDWCGDSNIIQTDAVTAKFSNRECLRVCVARFFNSITWTDRIENRRRKNTHNFAPIFSDTFNFVVRCHCMRTGSLTTISIWHLEFNVDVSTAACRNVNVFIC